MTGLARAATAVGIVALPFVLAIAFRGLAALCPAEERWASWQRFRLHTDPALLGAVCGWWAMWVVNRRTGDLVRFEDWQTGNDASYVFLAAAFWLPPTIGLAAFLIAVYSTDSSLLNLRWGTKDAFRRAWWKWVSFGVPLLLVALGFDELLAGNPWGVAFIAGAGVLNRVGTIFLRISSGFYPHNAKSGELRNRVLSIAHRMGVTVSRIYIVPAGKGHLTNAYAGSRAVFLTDNLGKYLSKSQLDVTIAHELAHLKLRHSRKGFVGVMAYFSTAMAIAYSFRQILVLCQPWIDVALLGVPILGIYYLSRRNEFAADRAALEFTGDAEAAIRALANLYAVSAAPLRFNGLTQLFQTHPPLSDRAKAIAEAGDVSTARVAEITVSTR